MQKQLQKQEEQLKAQQKLLEEMKKKLDRQEAELNAQKQKADQLDKTSKDVTELKERLNTVETAVGEPGPNDFRVYWDKGLRLKTHNGNFSIKIGGRVQNDWSWLEEDGDIHRQVGDQEDGVEFRRVRLYASGDVYERFDYKLQFDFAGGSSKLKDAYMGIKDLPIVGHLKAGHFKEPFSLEELTSSKYITFMERALPNCFAPSRNTGVQVMNNHFEERMTWAVGVFRNTNDYGMEKREGGYNTSARLTCLPWYEEDGARLLHLGVSGSYRDSDSVSFSQRPENHLADKFVSTGALSTDYMLLGGPEAALVVGPFSLQGEAIGANINLQNDQGATCWGGYVQGSYFLTGEHRKYKKSAAQFDRVKPKKDFLKDGGLGAWELAARYSYLDLEHDQLPKGNTLSDVTLGLNWHLNPNMRVMWNYVRAHLHGVGDSNIFAMRLQVDF